MVKTMHSEKKLIVTYTASYFHLQPNFNYLVTLNKAFVTQRKAEV